MKNILICGFLIAWAGFAHAATVLSPLATGNSASFAPFLIPPSAAPSVRYQQVYAASDFTRNGSSPLLITQMSFEQFGPGVIDTSLPNLRINFSTTSRVPDGLSSVFAENVGANDAVVFSGPLHVVNVVFVGFSVHIPLQTPFLYDPSMGNLLLDVRNFATANPFFPGPFGSLVTQLTPGDTTSLMIATNVNATSGFASTEGLLTRFTVTAVPEPGTGTLVLLGVSLFIVARGKKSKTQTPIQGKR